MTVGKDQHLFFGDIVLSEKLKDYLPVRHDFILIDFQMGNALSIERYAEKIREKYERTGKTVLSDPAGLEWAVLDALTELGVPFHKLMKGEFKYAKDTK